MMMVMKKGCDESSVPARKLCLRAKVAPTTLACSRLRDGGGKSFSNKKCEKRAGAGERQRVLFSLCLF